MNNNKYQLKFIFEYYEKRLLSESIELLKENRLEQFKQYYLMFNDDYASPIFDKNNDEIGYAYLYHPNIQDYSNYIINSNLIAFVRLYFYNAKIYLNNNKIRNGKYFLINPEFVKAYKNYYKYSIIENTLKNIQLVQQIIFNMNKPELVDIHKIIDDKKICIIIKNNLSEINKEFLKFSLQKNFKPNIREEPEICNFENNPIFYFNNFELIDEDIYEILFHNDNAQSENYRECFFENNYIYFTVPANFCNNKYPRNIEICHLNQNNTFSAKFLMEQNDSNSFQLFIQTTKQNGGFSKCLESYKGTEELYSNNGQQLGFIHNLMFKYSNQNIQNNNNNPNIQSLNNININNNNNNNFAFNNIQGNNSNQIFNPNLQNNWQNINNNINMMSNSNNNINNNNFMNNNLMNNNNLYNTYTTPPKQTLRSEFIKAPLIGLKNVGATCYMNATLQCLSQIEKLADYFKNHKRVQIVIKKLKNQDCLEK